MPVISITGIFGVKPALRAAVLSASATAAAGRLADRTATLADQEHDRSAAGVIVDAGEKRVAALDAMDETVRVRKSSAR